MLMSCASSVATTSSKSPPVLKAEIRKVLDRMQVQYRETKSGFECIHLPSIDVSSVDSPSSPHHHHQQMSSGSGEPPLTPTYRTGTARPKIVKKVSKLSFGFHREKGKDRDREPSIESSTGTVKEKELPGRPSAATTLTATPSSGSSSFFNVSSQQTAIPEVTVNGTATAPATANPDPTPSLEIDVRPPSRSQSPSSVKSKMLPPIPRDFGMMPRATSPSPLSPVPLTGEVADRDMFETMGRNTLSVRFEINIVKVRSCPVSFSR